MATVESGVLDVELLEAIDGTGYTMIIGSCPTVGLAGFTLGGGHSDMLSNIYGLAASNVIEAVVVLSDG